MSSIPSSISGKCVAVPIVAGVGNALMAVPLVRQLKTRAGAGEVVVVARTNAMAEPFRRLGEVDRVLVTGGGGKNLVKGILATRALRADAYVVPFPSNRWQYSLLAGASGARRKVLHSYPVGRWRTLAFAVGERTPGVRGIHDVVQNLNLLRMFGVEPDVSEAPLFALREDDRAAAGRLLESAGVVGSFAAVHAGSARTILAKAKRWPTEKYAQLVQRLISDVVSQVVILEGPDEAGVAGSILQNAQAELGQPGGGAKVIKLAGPLGEAAALLERAAFYVGSDSGLAHLAASVGTRAATIFAPADPDRVCPFGNRDLVVQPAKSCCPCFEYPWECPYPRMKCVEPMCVNEVQVDDVVDAARRAKSSGVRGPSGAAAPASGVAL